MKTILTLLILFVSINTQAQSPTPVLIKTNTDSVLNAFNQRLTKMENDSLGIGAGIDYDRVRKIISLQSVLNQLSTMQSAILTLQAANEALRVRLAGLKITATVQ